MSEKIFCTLRIERSLSPWADNRWEYDRQTCKPVLKTTETFDPTIALTADELTVLVYMYFTKRETTGVSAITYHEIAKLLGYNLKTVDTRIYKRTRDILSGILIKCAPERKRTVAVTMESQGTSGWDKMMLINIASTSLTELKPLRDGNITYLQMDNLEFKKIWRCSMQSGYSMFWLLTVYMYIKTFFSSSVADKSVTDNKILVWGGWRRAQLGEKDLQISCSKYRKLREALVESGAFIRSKENKAWYATADIPEIWLAIEKRYGHRWSKDLDKTPDKSKAPVPNIAEDAANFKIDP